MVLDKRPSGQQTGKRDNGQMPIIPGRPGEEAQGQGQGIDDKHNGGMPGGQPADGQEAPDGSREPPSALIETKTLEDGTLKTINNGDDSYVIREPGEKGKVLETRDAHGVVSRYNHRADGEIEVQRSDTGKSKVYTNANIDDQGALSWTDGDNSYISRLDGYRESRNLKDGSAEIHYPDNSVAKQRRDDQGIHTTTFVKEKIVAEKTEFAKPVSRTVETANGTQKFDNVSSMATYYDPKTGKHIAQSLTFAPPGWSKTINVPGGTLNFKASSVDIFEQPDDNKPSETIYYSDKDFTLVKTKDEQGKDRQGPISANRLHEIRDRDGALVLGLSSKEKGNEPLAYIYGRPGQAEKGTGKSPEGQTEKISEQHQAQIKALISRLSSAKHEDRKMAITELTKLGREAFPQLRELAKGKDPDLSTLARTIMAAQYGKPLPDQFVKEMQDLNASIFLAKSSDGKNILSPAERAALIERADRPLIGGLDQIELEDRNETAARNKANAQADADRKLNENLDEMGRPTDGLDNQWAQLPLSADYGSYGSIAPESAQIYIQQASTRQLAMQDDPVAKAANRSANVRAACALGFSGTGNKADRIEAVKLLTDAVTRSPSIAPVIEDDGNGGVSFAIFKTGQSEDFIKAVIQSKAYDDPKFVEAFCDNREEGEMILNGIRAYASEADRAIKKPQ